MDIRYLLEDFFERKNIQRWRYKRTKEQMNNLNLSIINSKFFELFPIVTMPDGIRFYNSPYTLNCLCEVYESYQFSDIRKDDRVIDIGANEGCFSIPASRLSSNVNAVEPITLDELKRNIELNYAQINIIIGALGDGQKYEISWGNTKKVMNTYSFSQMKEICGGCDFLKCDCEGFEWFIKPEELKGVRRLEMELHNINPSESDPHILIDYIVKNYETVMVSKTGRILEEFNMNFKKKFTISANEFILLHATRQYI